jgi:hypothetical protein
MPDEFTRQQSAQAVRFYAAYRKELDDSPVGGRFMPYRWWTLPSRISVIWMPYSQMLDEYASELANIINALTHHVHRLKAWARVVVELSDEEKLAATHEFIDMLGTVALGAPYAIKSRFGFAAAQLCHQANIAKDPEGWRDELPDERLLHLNDVDPICNGWQRYRAFKQRVEPLAGSAFKAATDDFRNAYNHRFSVRFVIGMSGTVSRVVGRDGQVGYAIGGSEPLDLDRISDLLAAQRDLCYRAFEAFQALVGEQIELITAFEAQERSGAPSP